MYRSDRIIIRYFACFRNRFFPEINFSNLYRRTFYQVFRIFVKSSNLKNQGFFQNDLIIFRFYRHGIQENLCHFLYENGKYLIQEDYRADVSYGNGIRAVISMLYSDGTMANDRIANFINGLSGDTLKLSNGTVYNVCRQFSELCATQTPAITNEILANDVLCTDATTMYIDGNQKNIRNFSSERSALYTFQDSKALKVLAELPILSTFSPNLNIPLKSKIPNFQIWYFS